MKIESEDLTQPTLTQLPSKNGTRPESSVRENGFTISLSISKDKIRTKAQGETVTEYIECDLLSSDKEDIQELFTTRNYSTNVWDGPRHGVNYVGMTGVSLDFDSGMTIEEAKAAFADYNYVLHTSTSHQVDKDGFVADRFRVILPFMPNGLRFTTQADCKRVYQKLLTKYPQMDAACTDAGRQFFPFCDDKGAKFELYTNDTGCYFDVDISDMPDVFVPEAFEEREWDGHLRPRNELERILKFCPFVKWMDHHIGNPKTEMHEPLRFALISNLCWYEGGREEIHRILSRDCRPGKYYPGLVDEKIDRILEAYNPQTYELIVRLGWPGPALCKPLSPSGWGRVGTKAAREFVQIDWDDNVIVDLNGAWVVVGLEDLKADLLPVNKKMAAICPVCGAEAVVKLDTFHFANIWCEQCQKAFYEAALSPGMFTYKNKLLRVERRAGQFISMEVLEEESFRTGDEFKFAKKKLLTDPNRRFLDDGFQIRRIGSADFGKLVYEFRMQENALLFKYPAIPVRIKDNAFINNFLDPMFGQYVDFIKDWMAVFCYTNYQTLPVIVLTSERSCGKGTFANMLSAIFPTLVGQWDGVKESFNDQYKNKLLFVDENPNAEKPMQYTEIKKITGNRLLRINEKYTPAYYAPNNINIIIATNDPRPMFLKAREEPKSENTNNFFIHRVPDVNPDRIDKTLGNKLEDRIGYYVRTELKERYQRLLAEGNTNNRYTLAAPITPLARDLFASSKSTVEIEADELARYLVCGVEMPDPYGDGYSSKIKFTATEYNGAKYVQLAEIRLLISRLRFKGSSNPKAYISVLQDLGVLSFDASARSNVRHLGYKILRDQKYYDPQQPSITGTPGVSSNGNVVFG
ncbi:MAG TPA: primase-helicase family protein [bacterium]|jgi:hypothetical protein